MEKTCLECKGRFSLSADDQKVFAKFVVPEPKLCPDCRMQRRMSFRNEMNFHKAKCALTGKSILTNIPSDRGYTVYSSEAWYSDKFDARDYARDFEFSRPSFDQIAELFKAVPHPNLMLNNCENCDYCNNSVNSKNCYLCGRLAESEQCYYSYLPLHCLNVFDSYFTERCQNCYQAIDCADCYNVRWSKNLKTSRDCTFCEDCIGCHDCFGCINLRHKEYCFFNEQLGKDEYQKKISAFNTGSHKTIQSLKEKFKTESQKHPHRDMILDKCENCTGCYISQGKNVYESYDITDAEDVRYSAGIHEGKDIYDVYAHYVSELCYECVGVFTTQRAKFCHLPYGNCSDLEYCLECVNNTKNCFGCVGLKHNEYCILNKQFTKEEYEKPIPKIIDHMKQMGEYGEFFPMTMSPFAYNESVAYPYFPMTEQEANAKHLFWYEEKTASNSTPFEIPDNIKDVTDDILKIVLTCEKTGRPYKIIPQELEFYRKHAIPIPRICPYERHLARINARAPRHLFSRTCAKCKNPIQTTYSPERPEIVYCESCYLETIY